MIFRKHPERRQYERLSCYCLVKYKLLGQKGEYNETLASLRNLSAGGMLLKAKERLAVGSRLVIKINIPSLSGAVIVNGQVVRFGQSKTKGGYWYGVKFSEINEGDKDKLISFIHSRR